jgi:cytoskeletal protein RodZ
MTSVNDNVLSSDHITLSPGEYLRQARQEARLGIEDIAKHLHLRHNIIEALEEDDYHALPENVFVKGYLRAYAKLLALSGDKIIAAFERASKHERQKPKTHIPHISRLPKPLKPPPQRLLWISGTVLACVLGLLAWRYNTSSHWA